MAFFESVSLDESDVSSSNTSPSALYSPSSSPDSAISDSADKSSENESDKSFCDSLEDFSVSVLLKVFFATGFFLWDLDRDIANDIIR